MVGTDSPDQAEIRELIRSILADHAPDEHVARLDESETFDEEFYDHLGAAGLIGLGADPATGDDADPRHEIVVLEELGASHTSMAVCLVVQYMALRLLSHYGDDEQRKRVLVPLAEGHQRLAFALSEEDGGTDIARAMRTKAVRDGSGWVLSGRKTWISGAAMSGHAIVLARTAEDARSAIDGITMFLVPLDADGVSVRVLDTAGIHGLDTCEVTFDEVRVDDSTLLGEVGAGFRQVIGTLNGERLNAAAVALGIARGALRSAVQYASQRQAFGRSVGAFQALQHSLVNGAVQVESARGLLIRAADAASDGNEQSDNYSAMAKIAAAVAATDITDAGMRVMGGAGYSREYPMQRYFRDARLYTFAPLTNEMLRNFVGERWLGLPRSY
ncbi:acyl-CoA dehydrogenase family protein [Saccharopolyspora mangrovi]|uniref:Acyl-CoA dehydrogenase family protein n=1 Tax=Saccharopolyspora mangrovi TaxID=3082379 RepID=A0ABU6AJK1_9PSEU|nr:acyl-CoA dehydrogenase family protein [Saccharopolyspora sp. S2-29]MEB3371749.1 acyl-CoA dehydrogenase family protein [Saccharopolyspora sp. S2-29]